MQFTDRQIGEGRPRWVETVTATDKSAHTISKIPTVTWLPPQYAKRQVLKFRLETSVTPDKRWVSGQ